MNYPHWGMDDKDTYFYKAIYAGWIKAVDFLCTLPEVDTTQVGVIGASQGGALSLVTASLDSRITACVAYHPALTEILGYAHGGTGGWPNLFKERQQYNNPEAKMKTMQYYDAVNFARQLQVLVYMMLGYNDRTCSPTSFYALYNTIPSQKQMTLARDCAHWFYPAQHQGAYDWHKATLKTK